MNDAPLHIVFAGGGTGGHLFPGLAVARQFAAGAAQVQITFVGSGKSFEQNLIQQAGFTYHAIPCHPLPRRPRKLLTFLAANLAGFRAARRILRSTPVHAVVGLGGYASAPMARAAIASSIPLVLLEQNVVPGRATRWLASSARAVCTAFPQTAAHLPAGCPVHLIGTPIRPIPAHSDRPSDGRKRLLVLGGSGGAHALNESVPLALSRIQSRLADWEILHQSGESEQEATQERYRTLGLAHSSYHPGTYRDSVPLLASSSEDHEPMAKHCLKQAVAHGGERCGLEATVVGFLDDVPQALAAADLAICRAGGSTLAELAAAGIPAILLPFPYATHDHQRKNADRYTAAGGCITLDQRRLPAPLDHCLAELLGALVDDASLRSCMAAAMRSLARPDAAAQVADLLRTILAGQENKAAA